MDLPLHPKLVHLPIALAVLMPLLVSGVLFAVWRDWLPRRVFVFVFAGQLLLVGSGLLAMRSGEADEDRVERIVPEAAIEAHEEAAEGFVWAGGIVLGLALLPLVLRQRSHVLLAGALVGLGSCAVLGLGWQVGQAGGEIVYGRGGAAAFASPAAAAASNPPDRPATSHRKRDDD